MIQSHLRFPSYPSCRMTRLLHSSPSFQMIRSDRLIQSCRTTRSLPMHRWIRSPRLLPLDQLILMSRCCPKHLCCLTLHCYRKIRSFPNYQLHHCCRWRRSIHYCLSLRTLRWFPSCLMIR